MPFIVLYFQAKAANAFHYRSFDVDYPYQDDNRECRSTAQPFLTMHERVIEC